MAYDNPIPGFNTSNTINLRLWAAKPDTEFDLEAFNTGDYVQVGAVCQDGVLISLRRTSVPAVRGRQSVRPHACLSVATDAQKGSSLPSQQRH